MNVNTLKAVYFIGAGGIGMSALVRYFLSKGKKVAGYDRTPSELTQKLNEEGILSFSCHTNPQQMLQSRHLEYNL